MTDIPNDKLYLWVERAQSYLYSAERVEIVQILMLSLQDKIGLTNDEFHAIINNSLKPRTRCKHVKKDGSKCLARVVQDEEVCEKHL